MSTKLFYEGLNFALGWEGGETNDKDDSGGHTKYGISRNAHPAVDIKNLTLVEAQNIYLKEYWQKNFNFLNENLALKLFDLSINMGCRITIKILQKVLNDYFNNHLREDGSLGSLTTAAIKSVKNQQSLYSAFTFEMSMRYKKISSFRKNEKYFLGWINRLYSHPRAGLEKDSKF